MKSLAFIFTPLVLFALLVAYASIDTAAQPAAPACVTDEDRVNIRAMTLAALDAALKDHVQVLFAGWIKDPTHQPQRASAGIQAAIAAYQRARADTLKWNPASC